MIKFYNTMSISRVRVAEWIPYVGSIGTGIAVATLMWKDRPKVTNTRDIGISINYENESRIEEKEFAIKWSTIDYTFLPIWAVIDGNGKLTRTPHMSDLFLEAVPANAAVELYYYRGGTLDEYLPTYAYRVIDSKHNRKKVYLVKRKFYQDYGINRVYMIVKTPLDPSFKANINHSINREFIEIINQNRVDVVKYKITLPSNITKEYIDETNDLIEDIIERDNEPLEIIVRNVPRRSADQPGRIRIPFRVPIPLF